MVTLVILQIRPCRFKGVHKIPDSHSTTIVLVSLEVQDTLKQGNNKQLLPDLEGLPNSLAQNLVENECEKA